jgi:hypothetical protein
MGRLHSQIYTVISRAGAVVALSNLGARHLKDGQSLGTISNEDVARLRELDGIASEAKRLHTEAAIELRAALAEGDLVAVLNYEEMPQVERFRWREDDGLAIVLNGRLSNKVEGTLTQFRECAVVVNEADLMGWLSSSLQADSPASTCSAARSTVETARQVHGLAEHSQAPAGLDAQPADVLGSVVDQRGVRAEDAPQSAPLALVPSDADRPKATISALTEWFRVRVATWPDIEAAPSEPNDVRAAIDYFAPGLTRDEVRTIRGDATPSQWRKQGRRKPWGNVKPTSAE